MQTTKDITALFEKSVRLPSETMLVYADDNDYDYDDDDDYNTAYIPESAFNTRRSSIHETYTSRSELNWDQEKIGVVVHKNRPNSAAPSETSSQISRNKTGPTTLSRSNKSSLVDDFSRMESRKVTTRFKIPDSDDSIVEYGRQINDDCYLKSKSAQNLYRYAPHKVSNEPQNGGVDDDVAESMMTRRQFHRGNFIRYRYPTQFHVTGTAQSPAESKLQLRKQRQLTERIPSSLCPPARYGKEPKVQGSRTGGVVRTTDKSNAVGEPRFPKYPSRMRSVATECEILRWVETEEKGVQVSKSTAEIGCQSSDQSSSNASTQHPLEMNTTDAGSQTGGPQMFVDKHVQATPSTRNCMTETSVRILYYPEVNTQNNWTQYEEQCPSAAANLANDIDVPREKPGFTSELLNHTRPKSIRKNEHVAALVSIIAESDDSQLENSMNQLKSEMELVKPRDFCEGAIQRPAEQCGEEVPTSELCSDEDIQREVINTDEAELKSTELCDDCCVEPSTWSKDHEGLRAALSNHGQSPCSSVSDNESLEFSDYDEDFESSQE